MTPHQVGRIARALRHRQRLRQLDVAARAGVSRLAVVRLEGGDGGKLPLSTTAAIFDALGGRAEIMVTWQGAALDRVVDEGHARLSGRVMDILQRAGWETKVEVSFSVYGDRGSIDILAWHPASRTLLVIEIKTELGSVEGLLRPLDIKYRLARDIARHRFGWHSASISRLVVMPEDSTGRRQVERHSSFLDVAFPQRSRDVRRWLGKPLGTVSGLWFLSLVRSANTRRNPSAIRRIRRQGPRSATAA